MAKLLGDTKSLEEEIDEYIKQINKEIKEIKSLENSIEMSKLDFKDRQKLSDLKVTIDLTKHKTNKAKQEIDALKREIEKDNGEQKEISQLQRRLQKLVDYAKEIIENKAIEIVTKEIANYWAPKVAKILNSPEAYQLYRVGSPGLNNNPEYIQKNAKLYNSINDLKNINLKQNIKARLNAETEKTDCKVLHLRSDSSIAQKIENSQEFKDFLINNPLLFKPNSFLQEGEIIFRENSDLYNSLHGALIKNAKTDAHGNLTLTVQDLWNFNKGRPSLRGRVGEKLQNEGSLENYYIIIDIKIPKEKLEFYKKI